MMTASCTLDPTAFSRLVLRLQQEETLLQLESQHVGETLMGVGFTARLSCYGEQAFYETPDRPARQKTQSPWQALREFRDVHAGKWLLGMLGYDLKNSIEALESANPDAVGAPDLLFFVPRQVMRYRADTGRLDVLAGPASLPRPLLREAESGGAEPDFSFRLPTGDAAEKRWYTGIIEEARRDIFEGLYYEINLSRELRGHYTGTPYQLYRRMKAAGPVPFGAFFSFDSVRDGQAIQLCCASPERFLQRKGAVIKSQPIKGTAAVSATGDAEENRRIAAALLQSEKNRAENLMIVDLVRHDLNRICKAGSVKVPELFGIHRFPTVFQMISTVEGQLRDGIDEVRLLQSCFPMGSMTGAPKISTMRRIDALEKRRRGIYSGALGYISPDGDMDFNVIIRSAICKNGALYYNAGGAITADSDPLDEWEETLVKAAAILRCQHAHELPSGAGAISLHS